MSSSIAARINAQSHLKMTSCSNARIVKRIKNYTSGVESIHSKTNLCSKIGNDDEFLKNILWQNVSESSFFEDSQHFLLSFHLYDGQRRDLLATFNAILLTNGL